MEILNNSGFIFCRLDILVLCLQICTDLSCNILLNIYIMLERVQRKFVSILLGLEVFKYVDSLDSFILDHWMLRGDHAEVYKIMRYIDKVNSHCLLLRIGEFETRGHRFEVGKD